MERARPDNILATRDELRPELDQYKTLPALFSDHSTQQPFLLKVKEKTLFTLSKQKSMLGMNCNGATH